MTARSGGARELAGLLGYDKWYNFAAVVRDAMLVFRETAQHERPDDTEYAARVIAENYTDVSKVSGKRGPKQQDWRLSKRACYVVAENADPRSWRAITRN